MKDLGDLQSNKCRETNDCYFDKLGTFGSKGIPGWIKENREIRKLGEIRELGDIRKIDKKKFF